MNLSAVKRWTRVLIFARRMSLSEFAAATKLAQSDVSRSLRENDSGWTTERLGRYADALGLPVWCLLKPESSEEAAIEVLSSYGLPPVPAEFCWDCRGRLAPADLDWRLKRVARFFPRIGRDPATVNQLQAHMLRLKLPRQIWPVVKAFAA